MEAVVVDLTPAFTFVHSFILPLSLSLSLSGHVPPLVFNIVSFVIYRSTTKSQILANSEEYCVQIVK